MTSKPLFFILIAISLLAVSCGTHEAARPWQLRPVTDSVYHFVIADETVHGMQEDIFDTITTGFSLRCTQQTDSLLTFQLVFEQLKRTPLTVGLMMPGKSPAEMENMRRAWQASVDSCRQGVIGDSLEIVYNTKGKLLHLRGVDRILEKIARITHKDPRTVYSDLGGVFNTNVMQDLLTRLFFYLPGRLVQANDNWVSNYTLIAKAPVKYSNLITVQQVSGDSVILAVKTMVTAKTGENGRVFAEGNQWGTIKASVATGLLYSVTLSDTMVSKTDTYQTKERHRFTVRMH